MLIIAAEVELSPEFCSMLLRALHVQDEGDGSTTGAVWP